MKNRKLLCCATLCAALALGAGAGGCVVEEDIDLGASSQPLKLVTPVIQHVSMADGAAFERLDRGDHYEWRNDAGRVVLVERGNEAYDAHGNLVARRVPRRSAPDRVVDADGDLLFELETDQFGVHAYFSYMHPFTIGGGQVVDGDDVVADLAAPVDDLSEAMHIILILMF